MANLKEIEEIKNLGISVEGYFDPEQGFFGLESPSTFNYLRIRIILNGSDCDVYFYIYRTVDKIRYLVDMVYVRDQDGDIINVMLPNLPYQTILADYTCTAGADPLSEELLCYHCGKSILVCSNRQCCEIDFFDCNTLKMIIDAKEQVEIVENAIFSVKASNAKRCGCCYRLEVEKRCGNPECPRNKKTQTLKVVDIPNINIVGYYFVNSNGEISLHPFTCLGQIFKEQPLGSVTVANLQKYDENGKFITTYLLIRSPLPVPVKKAKSVVSPTQSLKKGDSPVLDAETLETASAAAAEKALQKAARKAEFERANEALLSLKTKKSAPKPVKTAKENTVAEETVVPEVKKSIEELGKSLEYLEIIISPEDNSILNIPQINGFKRGYTPFSTHIRICSFVIFR